MAGAGSTYKLLRAVFFSGDHRGHGLRERLNVAFVAPDALEIVTSQPNLHLWTFVRTSSNRFSVQMRESWSRDCQQATDWSPAPIKAPSPTEPSFSPESFPSQSLLRWSLNFFLLQTETNKLRDSYSVGESWLLLCGKGECVSVKFLVGCGEATLFPKLPHIYASI